MKAHPLYPLAMSLLLLETGCGGPSQVNNDLRKKNLDQQNQIDQLQRDHVGDQQEIRALQQHATTVPELPENRLDKLYLPEALSLGRLTGGAHLAEIDTVDTGVKVFVVPTDQDGQVIKVAGSFDVDVYDLDVPDHPLVAHAHFSTEQARKNWYGEGFLYTYVLPVPWSQAPRHENLTVHVTFRDELTGREMQAQKQIKIELVPASAPSSK